MDVALRVLLAAATVVAALSVRRFLPPAEHADREYDRRYRTYRGYLQFQLYSGLAAAFFLAAAGQRLVPLLFTGLVPVLLAGQLRHERGRYGP